MANDNYILFECGLCPNCGSDKIRIAHTKKPKRRMECPGCRATWETLTVNLWDPEALERAGELARQRREFDESLPFL